MGDPRLLRLHALPTGDWGMFCPVSRPAFVGSFDPGIDWLCPRCSTVLVQGAAQEDQFLNLLFRCHSCDAIGGSPLRQPGRPLAGRPLLTPPGKYRLESTVDMSDRPVMCVGQQAIDGYVAETGAGQRAAGAADGDPSELTPAGLRGAAAFVVKLLGDRYPRLVAADERGRASPTPPRRRHRLIELIDYAEVAASLLEQRRGAEQVELDGNLLSELFTTTALLRRWRNHPAWPRLVDTLASDTEVQHTVMVLAVASYLVDAGNGVGIVVDDAGSRVADIWTEPTLLERLEVEVKTPQDLRGPRAAPLEVAEAVKLLGRQLKRAAATKGGQLSTDHSGIVAIGGYHLGAGSLDVLEASSKQILTRQGGRKRHLAALVVSELSYRLTNVEDQSVHQGSSSLTPTLESRLVKHPSYGGALEIRQEQAPWQQFPPARNP